MRNVATTSSNSAATVAPSPNPSSAWRIAEVTPLPKYKLKVRFVDGTTGDVELAGLIQAKNAGVFAALRDPAIFAQAHVHLGAVTWPGDIDLAPDAMYRAICEFGVWRVEG